MARLDTLIDQKAKDMLKELAELEGRSMRKELEWIIKEKYNMIKSGYKDFKDNAFKGEF